MAFGQDFLNGFFGNDYLRDYTHASRTFTTNGYANSPRFKFLFHVYFTLDTVGIPMLRNAFSKGDNTTIGLLVKNIELPKFTIDTEILNQYNRKRVIQKKINYDPINVAFHDDGNDLIRTLWYNYYSYYYKDPTQPYNGLATTAGTSGPMQTQQMGFNYNSRDIYDNTRAVSDWGYVGESYSDGTSSANGKPSFFRDISIYGFNQHKFVRYVLINPVISQWSHDQYDYAQDAGVMENKMTIQYETVKYYSGAIGGQRADTNVVGFADPNTYDQRSSPLSRPGGVRSIIGQGGLLDTGLGIIGDLQAVAQGTGGLGTIIGAVAKAGTLYNTFKGQDLASIAKSNAVSLAAEAAVALRQALPGQIRNATTPIGNALRKPLFPIPPTITIT
jgi:hypothetical protein